MSTSASKSLFHLWDQGQQELAGGAYIKARRSLEAAEALAWRTRDAQSLARLYLPLLETRRLIRYQAAEGALVICEPKLQAAALRHALSEFLASQAGTILLPASSAVRKYASSVRRASERTTRPLEALILIRDDDNIHLATPVDSVIAAGLPVRWTKNTADQIGPSTDPELTVPLPLPGRYAPSPRAATSQLHALVRESLLVAWEALALRWQHRHPLPARARCGSAPAAGWHEITWLRRALRIDPACEPITMRLIAVAEALQRS
jgi:hypothetical protein